MSTDLPADIVELVACSAVPPSPTTRLDETAFRRDAWLAAEVATLRTMFAADEPIAGIALTLGRPVHGTRTKIAELGLRRNSARPWSDLEDAELARDYGVEATATLASRLGRAVPAVYCRARLLGLSDPAIPAWTPWEDAQLRSGYASGVPVAQIAVLIGRTLAGTTTRASTLGLRHLHHPADWSEAELLRMLSLAESGMRYLAIIEQLVDEGFPRRTKAGFGPQLRRLGYGRGWGRPWTPEEDDLIRAAYTAGTSLTPVLATLGRTKCSLRWRVKELGLQGSHVNHDGFRGGPVWTEADLAFLRANYGTMTTRDLATVLGRKLAAIYTRANVLGLRHPFLRDFTTDDDAAIRAAWHDGTPLRALGAALGRDQAVISKHAIRLGMPFDSPDRPVRPSRGRRSSRQEVPS